jgi:hypothetical protein
LSPPSPLGRSLSLFEGLESCAMRPTAEKHHRCAQRCKCQEDGQGHFYRSSTGPAHHAPAPRITDAVRKADSCCVERIAWRSTSSVKATLECPSRSDRSHGFMPESNLVVGNVRNVLNSSTAWDTTWEFSTLRDRGLSVARRRMRPTRPRRPAPSRPPRPATGRALQRERQPADTMPDA